MRELEGKKVWVVFPDSRFMYNGLYTCLAVDMPMIKLIRDGHSNAIWHNVSQFETVHESIDKEYRVLERKS